MRPAKNLRKTAKKGLAVDSFDPDFATHRKNLAKLYGKPFSIDLNEKHDVAATPEKVLVPMWHHQLVSLAAIISAESTRKVETDENGTLVYTPFLMYSDPIGVGKTLVLLALVASSKIPRPILPTPLEYDYGLEARVVGDGSSKGLLISSTLVFVGASVLLQWKDEIEKKTSMTYMIVSNKVGFERLADCVADGTISAFDIVVVKCGQVTGNVIHEKIPTEKSVRSTFEAVFSISAGKQWARVIYDDYDTVNIPGDAVTIMANSSIFVSSTGRLRAAAWTRTTEKRFCNYLPNICRMANNNQMQMFTIKCAKDFIETSKSVPTLKFFEYAYDNPHDTVIEIIGKIAGDIADEIVEMLNGDAISTAADKMGIKAASVTDVFSKILGNRWEKYRHFEKTVEFIDKYIDYLEDCIDELDPDEEIKEHSEEKLAAAKKKLKKQKRPKLSVTSGLQDVADEALNETKDERDTHGAAIQRAKDNIREGECQVCKIEFNDPLMKDTAVIINRCCGIILCEICGIKGNQIGKKGYGGKSHLSGSCANCKAKIDPSTDIVFVDQNIKLDDLVNSRGIVEEQVEIPQEQAEETPDEKPKPNPKHVALLSIIRGEVPEGREEINIRLKNLLEGTVDKPYTNVGQVIVFASYGETLGSAIKFMTESGITSKRLQGTSKMRDDIVKEFSRGDFQVLCISAQDTCAGLNLQFATDLVFMHDIIDTNTVEQVIGRIHRIDRPGVSAHIHFLRYKNEQRAARNRERAAGWRI